MKRKNIVGISLIMVLLVVISSFAANSMILRSEEECAVGNFCSNNNSMNPLGVSTIQVDKKIWSGTAWVDTINADIDDIVQFNITITYHEACGYKATNIVVDDTLPSCLEYSGGAVVVHGGNTFTGESEESENFIIWNLTEDYGIELWDTNRFPNKPPRSVYIEFFATIIEYTDSDGENNTVDVTALETCCHEDCGGHDEATVIITEIIPTIEVTKTASPEEIAEPGGLVTFTVEVENTGVETVTLTSLVDDTYGDLNGVGDCSLPQVIVAGGTYTCSFQATVTGNAGDSETDTVTALAEDDEENPASDSDSATVTIIDGCCKPGIDVTKFVKWDCTPPYKKNVTADVGDWVTFKLYVNNTGDVDITVKDVLPSGLSYVTDSTDITGISVSPEEPEISGNILYWNFTDVPDGTSIVITSLADVDECGEHINLVNVTGECGCEEVVYDEDTAIVWVPCPPGEGDLTVEKYVKWDCTPPYEKNVTAAVGDWITFKLYINNTGDVPLDIDVRDELPSGLSYVTDSTGITGISVSPEDPEISGNMLYWNFTNVPDSASIVITFRADVNECGEHVNVANVTGEYECHEDIYDEDTAIVWVPCVPGIAVDKKASLDGVNWVDDTIDTFVGDTVFFKINVSNTGGQALNGVVLLDNLPSFLTFNDDANPINIYYSAPDNEIRWFFSHIPVGEYRVITFSATVTDMGIDENIATVTTCGGPGAEDDVTIDASGGMHVEKLVSLDGEHWLKNVTADIGDTVRFIINISYYTDSDLFLFDFYIEDTLPCGLVYADDAYPKEPEIAGQTLYWNFTGDDEFLLNGSYLTVEFNATVFCEGEAVNIVTVTARECSDTTLYGEDEAIVYVEPGPCMMCEKTVQAANGSWVDEINSDVGDIVRFNITVSNAGYNPIYDIAVRDILPSILTYVSNSAVIKYDGETIVYSDCWGYDVYDEENNTLFFYNLNLCTEEYLSPDEKISLLFNAEVIAEGIGVNLANITARTCGQCDWLQCSDTAVVNASTTGNHAPAASGPDPADDSTDVNPDDVTLSVTAIDNDGDTMDVSFYNASDDSLIKKVTGVSNDSTTSATWGDLAHNTTYTWYVVVDDSKTTVQSATWSFKTEPVGVNHAPDAPYNPTPYNGANNVDRNPTLQVRVSDPDDDTLTVRFYDASDDSLIGTKNNVASGGTASFTWSGLSASTSYSWYAKASDSEYTTSSSTWSFTTESSNIDLAVDLKGGLGVKVEIMNSGSDDAENVDWSISVKNKGPFNRINGSNQGVISVLEGNGDIVAKKLMFFGIGRIEITATAECAECTAVTETADGIILGFFVIITNAS